ncbi:MAG: uroporphyrinogen decarboxylase, partial [Acidobacteriota bacterium]|nr:uroporphyrinogen decarboxylase [Acidobacteriota bacterium]
MSGSLLLRALRGERAERRPLWIMRQAGRYLPEYRQLRSRRSFEEICSDPEIAAEVTLMPLRRFPLDAAIVFADLVTPLVPCGVRVRFDPGPVIGEPVRDAAGLDRLRIPVGGGLAAGVAETIRMVRRELESDVPIIGFAGAPLTMAAYLVEGRGVRGFPRLMHLIESEEQLAQRLLDRLARIAAVYLR